VTLQTGDLCNRLPERVMNQHLSLSTPVLALPRRPGLRAGEDNRLEVLVRIQAPDAPAGHVAERPPQALALVIDRSGSMAGRPLDEARRCAGFVLERLRPGDAVSLVQFDNRVQRLWPATPLGDGRAQRAVIAGIRPGGNTDLHGGWKEGADTLSEVAGQGLKRVILLSDGQANEGLTDAGEIARQCAQRAAQGITTSTYGLGRSFNEELMVAMARAGGGNAYYGETAEDLMEPFEQELALLGNLCLRELRVEAIVPEGAAVTCANGLPERDGAWCLPDLAWGAEAWLVLRIGIPAAALPPAGRMPTVLRVVVTARSPEGEPVRLEHTGLALPVLGAAAWDALAEDELVCRRLTELQAAESLARLRDAARRDDWAAVDALLDEAVRCFGGNAWVGAMLAAMQAIARDRDRERLGKEAMYSSGRLRSRLAAKDEHDALAAGEATEIPAYLRRKPAQGKADL
jgi:Ca-activated chloride channel family protein